MHKTIISIAAIATVLTAAPAFAGQDSRSASVRIDDLDLSQPGDAAILDRRVAVAKEGVCGSYFAAREGEVERIAQCRAVVDRQLETRLAAAQAPTRLASR